MGGFDTIGLWLPFERAGNTKLLIDVPKNLDRVKKITDESGQACLTGYLGGNLKVNVSLQGVSIKGSLSKYFLSDNLQSLTRSDTQRALEKMSDSLHVEISKALVRRIDFAVNLMMDQRPVAYYLFLGNSRYRKRSEIESSLYYSASSMQVVFYDKIREMKSGRLNVPIEFEQSNVLRLEMRARNRLQMTFNRAEINAELLQNEKFYIEVADKLLEEYEAIEKLKTINFHLNTMKSPKDFWQQVQADWIKRTGGELAALERVEQIRRHDAFKNPEYYSRLKREIKQLCQAPDLTTDSMLVHELDKKVRRVKAYYR
jgi:hypothetical protein